MEYDQSCSYTIGYHLKTFPPITRFLDYQNLPYNHYSILVSIHPPNDILRRQPNLRYSSHLPNCPNFHQVKVPGEIYGQINSNVNIASVKMSKLCKFSCTKWINQFLGIPFYSSFTKLMLRLRRISVR